MQVLRASFSLSRFMATSATPRGMSSFARAKAEEISRSWKGTSATGGRTKYPIALSCHSGFNIVTRNYIGGQFVESQTSEWLDVLDPVSWICALREFVRTEALHPQGHANSSHPGPTNYPC